MCEETGDKNELVPKDYGESTGDYKGDYKGDLYRLHYLHYAHYLHRVIASYHRVYTPSPARS